MKSARFHLVNNSATKTYILIEFLRQVCTEAGSRVKLSPLRRMTLPYTINNLRWLNPRSLAVLDTQERLHLIDVRAQDNLETLDMSRVGISYASSHFKGLSTGGNVSKVRMSHTFKAI